MVPGSEVGGVIRSLSPQKIEAWSKVTGPAVTALGVVLAALIGGLATLGSGCVKIKTDVGGTVRQMQEDAIEERRYRDQQDREIREQIGETLKTLRETDNRSRQNETRIDSYHGLDVSRVQAHPRQ